MVSRILVVAAIIAGLKSVASADIIVVDSSYGPGTITRDTAQQLDFLDLGFTTGMSFNEVSVEFGAGGEFAGFRYASQQEVINLINNFGFTPSALLDSLTNGDPGDQLSALVDYLDVTSTGFGVRSSIGITAPTLSLHRQVRVQDFLDSSSSDIVNAQFVVFSNASSPNFGSFLVRESPPTNSDPVPEPSSIVLFAICAGTLAAAAIMRRKKFDSNG